MWLNVLFLAKKINDSSNLGQHKMEYDSSNLRQKSMRLIYLVFNYLVALFS